MKLLNDVAYIVKSGQRSIQIIVAPGATATLEITLPEASAPHTQTFTESQLLSGFIGYSIVKGSGAGCEFFVAPSYDVTKQS